MDIIDELIDNVRKEDVTSKEWLLHLLRKNLETLKAKNIDMVEVSYDGYGDSGDINGTAFYSETSTRGHNGFQNIDWSAICNIMIDDMRLEIFFEDLAWEYIPCGFEINEGSSGQVCFNLKKKLITIDHGFKIQHFESSEFEI